MSCKSIWKFEYLDMGQIVGDTSMNHIQFIDRRATSRKEIVRKERMVKKNKNHYTGQANLLMKGGYANSEG